MLADDKIVDVRIALSRLVGLVDREWFVLLVLFFFNTDVVQTRRGERVCVCRRLWLMLGDGWGGTRVVKCARIWGVLVWVQRRRVRCSRDRRR